MTGRIVFFGGTRGGVGKTVMSHAACLGAILHNQPAVYVLTDPMRKLREEGRPYGVLDGKDPVKLAHILEESRNGAGGWTIIDGGGNRPAFDEELAEQSDLCIFPFRNTDEDMDVVGNDLMRIPKAVAWPTAWPTSPYGLRAAQLMLIRFEKAFPLRVIRPQIPEVKSSAQLLSDSLNSPRTVVRRMASKVFEVMAEEFELRNPARTEQAKPTQAAGAGVNL
jgi:chromosome partitioning protein